MVRRPPSSTRTYPPFPDTTLVRSSSSRRSARASSLRRRVGSIVVLVGVRAVHQPVDGVHQVGVAADRGLAQRHGRRVQEAVGEGVGEEVRSEEHTSELQSLMRISYAVFCLKKKKKNSKYTQR